MTYYNDLAMCRRIILGGACMELWGLAPRDLSHNQYFVENYPDYDHAVADLVVAANTVLSFSDDEGRFTHADIKTYLDSYGLGGCWPNGIKAD